MKWGYPRIRAEEGIRAKEGQHEVGLSEDTCRGRYSGQRGAGNRGLEKTA